MKMKNICGKIPIELHAKVRKEIEHREISTQEFIQQVIEEHFMEKGVDAMVARTVAVQVTEELFRRLKAAIAWKGYKQKDFLLHVITKAIEDVEAEMEQKASQDVEQDVLWSSIFVTLMAKKYHKSVTLHSVPQTEFDNH